MGIENKYVLNQPDILTASDYNKDIQFGIVESNDDPQGMGRIKVRIPGPAQKGGDNDITTENLAWSYPMLPKFFSSTPKVGEGVFVMILTKQKTHSDRLYFGPIISTQDKLNMDSITTTALSPFNFGLLTPQVNTNRIPALKGVFPSNEDISIQGRFNTDLTFKNNEVVLRVGKFEDSTPSSNNPYSFQFNRSTQGYIQIKNNVTLHNDTSDNIGTVTNIVSNKINLITHKDGNPRFNVTNQDDLLSNDEILKILESAHPLPFGDILIQYLKLLKNAFLNHVHNNNGLQPTDLVVGGITQDVREFKKNAEDLENRMLSRNIRIN